MQLEALNRVLAGGRWFSFAAGMEAVRALPEVMDGLPYMTGDPPIMVVTCRETIKPLLRSPGIGPDPLVGPLYRLVEQGLLLSRSAAVLPLLETWRQMRAKVLALPPQGRVMEAAFQSSRLGAAIGTLPSVPALAKVLTQEQTALTHTDQDLESDGDTNARRRSLAIARLAAALKPPEDRTVELLRWPRMDEVKAGVLAVGLGKLRESGFSPATDRAWAALQAELPEALFVDQGTVGLILSVRLPALLNLKVEEFLGKVPLGLGYGPIQGGTDGEVTRVSGVAVDQAISAMVRGRNGELSLTDEMLAAVETGIRAAGARPVAGQHRMLDLGSWRYQLDVVGGGTYAIRARQAESLQQVAVTEPETTLDFESLLDQAFGAAPARPERNSNPPTSGKPTPSPGRPERTSPPPVSGKPERTDLDWSLPTNPGPNEPVREPARSSETSRPAELPYRPPPPRLVQEPPPPPRIAAMSPPDEEDEPFTLEVEEVWEDDDDTDEHPTVVTKIPERTASPSGLTTQDWAPPPPAPTTLPLEAPAGFSLYEQEEEEAAPGFVLSIGEDEDPAGYLPGREEPAGYLSALPEKKEEEISRFLPDFDNRPRRKPPPQEDETAFALSDEDGTNAGFTLEEEGSDPGFTMDDGESSGFALVEEPSVPPEVDRPTLPPVQPLPRQLPRTFHPAPDFTHLLAGYHWYPAAGAIVFGRNYDSRLVDYHRIDSTDPAAAHHAFLQQKIREGFMLQYDRMGDPPAGVKGRPLDTELLKEAWSRLA